MSRGRDDDGGVRAVGQGGLDAVSVDRGLQYYLRELRGEPLLSPDEEVKLARRMEDGQQAASELAADGRDPDTRAALQQRVGLASEARRQFILANTRLVVSIAVRYAGSGQDLLDLIQEGNVGLMQAVDRFDYRLGHRFSTYATWWIRQAIGRALDNQKDLIRIPVHTRNRLRKVQRASRELEKQLGRRPEPDEIAGRVGLSAKDVRMLFNWSRQLLSLEEPMNREGDIELGHLIPDDTSPQPPDAVARASLAEDADRALLALEPREELVLRLRLGFRDGVSHTLEEVGTLLGLSRERVRQIQWDALDRLRSVDGAQPLRDYR